MTTLHRRTMLAALATAPWAARSQAWPTRPIRLVVSFPPGSSPDVVARAVAPGLQQALGQPVVIENRAGANGTIGCDLVAKSEPDGHTLLMTSGSSMSIAPHTLARLPYQPERDLAPVAAGARIDLFLVARPAWRGFDEFLRHLTSNPGKLSYGSPGLGSAPHVATELFKSRTGTYAVHVPYKGSAPVLQDLLAGVLDFAFDPGVALAAARDGRLSLLAVGAARRLPTFPDVPTLAEVGLKDLDVGTTHGFWAPARTPPPVIERLNRDINRLLMQPEVARQIRALAAEPTPMSPQQLADITAADSRRYGAIVRERRIQE